MLPCKECQGSGFAKCAQCEGAGHVHEVRDSGESEYQICTECDGRKLVRCDACGGIGWLGADDAVAVVEELDAAGEDLLAERRNGGRPALAVIERLVSGDW